MDSPPSTLSSSALKVLCITSGSLVPSGPVCRPAMAPAPAAVFAAAPRLRPPRENKGAAGAPRNATPRRRTSISATDATVKPMPTRGSSGRKPIKSEERVGALLLLVGLALAARRGDDSLIFTMDQRRQFFHCDLTVSPNDEWITQRRTLSSLLVDWPRASGTQPRPRTCVLPAWSGLCNPALRQVHQHLIYVVPQRWLLQRERNECCSEATPSPPRRVSVEGVLGYFLPAEDRRLRMVRVETSKCDEASLLWGMYTQQ